ncbi:hypothetical protein E2C01_073926 [Portunus trituberculatus]|uniref:Uncharacterized protein n=1 Tax=Portunus trituberculatus TaxID=210409 RepID=A0A5B7I494_PORTR|nr:hypothetical protein [Portunus trituberculatus]
MSKGLKTLYKVKIRPAIEYSSLAWGLAANKNLPLLNKVQDRATRLISSGDTDPEPHLHTLQHRRDVVGLTVLFKVQEDRVSHFQPLKQPRSLSPVATRAVVQTPGELIQPRCRTWHEQRQFTNTYVKMWNAVIASGINLENTNVV